MREDMILRPAAEVPADAGGDAFAHAASRAEQKDAAASPVTAPPLVHNAPLARSWFKGGASGGEYEATVRKDGVTFYIKLLTSEAWSALLDAERRMLEDVTAVAADRDAADKVLEDYCAFQTKVLEEHLVGWTLPVRFGPEAIRALNRAAIEELCAELQLKSKMGKESAAFLGGR